MLSKMLFYSFCIIIFLGLSWLYWKILNYLESQKIVNGSKFYIYLYIGFSCIIFWSLNNNFSKVYLLNEKGGIHYETKYVFKNIDFTLDNGTIISLNKDKLGEVSLINNSNYNYKIIINAYSAPTSSRQGSFDNVEKVITPYSFDLNSDEIDYFFEFPPSFIITDKDDSGIRRALVIGDN